MVIGVFIGLLLVSFCPSHLLHTPLLHQSTPRGAEATALAGTSLRRRKKALALHDKMRDLGAHKLRAKLAPVQRRHKHSDEALYYVSAAKNKKASADEKAKKDVLSKLAKEADFHPFTTNFLNLLVDKKRIGNVSSRWMVILYRSSARHRCGGGERR